jgi:hypothetical protein
MHKTSHHITPKRCGGGDASCNLIDLDDRLHGVIHEVFDATHPSTYLAQLQSNPEEGARRIVRAIWRKFGLELIRAAVRDEPL